MFWNTRSRVRQGGNEGEAPLQVRSSKPSYLTYEHTSCPLEPVGRVFKGNDHRPSVRRSSSLRA